MHRLIALATIALTPALFAQQQHAPAPVKIDLPQVPGITWTRFTDPNEHAFSIDVPKGWKVSGGLVRRGPVDISMFLRALSPDDSELLILGDPDPAYFGTPGLGAARNARAYTPGEQYARQYIEQSLPGTCDNLNFISGSDRPDIANGPLAQGTPYARHDAGDVLFNCTHHGNATRVYLVAGTFLYASPLRGMPGSWGINMLAGCLAPADHLDTAKKIVLHMVLSARQEPDWVHTQQGIIDAATRRINIITDAQARAAQTNLDHAKATQAAMRGEYNAFNQIQTQTGTFSDGAGHVFTGVQNTQNYHWLSIGGQVAQTSSPTPPPGGGWTQLKQVPGQQ